MYMFITYDFSSDLFVLLIIVLFCWHVQQRSELGFVMMIWGRYVFQMLQNDLYLTTRAFSDTSDALYSSHIHSLVVFDGRSCRSNL